MIIVIGAGAAGLSAGITLLRNGIDCIMLDAFEYPREKLCGGLLTLKSYQYASNLISGLDSVIKSKVCKTRINSKCRKVVELDTESPFYLTERKEFDLLLYEQYIRLGGTFIKDRVTSISRNTVVTKSGNEYMYDFLIACDGVRGISRKYLSEVNKAVAFGVEVTLNKDEIKFCENQVILDVGLFDDGYLWVFPKGDIVTIGLAFTYKKGFDYVGALREYIKEEYNYEVQSGQIKGAFLPYLNGKSSTVSKELNMLVAGDAGGFIDSVTGEGIYYAMRTGVLAAEAIASETKDPLGVYIDSVSEISKQISESKKLITTFYRFRPLILKVAPRLKRPIEFFCEAQISNNNYNMRKSLLLKGYYDECRRRN